MTNGTEQSERNSTIPMSTPAEEDSSPQPWSYLGDDEATLVFSSSSTNSTYIFLTRGDSNAAEFFSRVCAALRDTQWHYDCSGSQLQDRALSLYSPLNSTRIDHSLSGRFLGKYIDNAPIDEYVQAIFDTVNEQAPLEASDQTSMTPVWLSLSLPAALLLLPTFLHKGCQRTRLACGVVDDA